jgi:hypothetical protein
MRRTASEIINDLEIRVAELEKEAGFIDDISSTFNGLVNIPKNIVKKIINGFADIYNTIQLEFEGNESKINDSLGALLGSRVFRAMAGVTTTRAGLPKIVSFNASVPLNSIFTGGKAEDKKIQLKDLVKKYVGENQTRMKSAYLSWYSDFKHILNPKKISEGESFKIFMDALKRYSKVLYRFFTSLIGVVGIMALKGTVVSTIIVMIARLIVQASGLRTTLADMTEYTALSQNTRVRIVQEVPSTTQLPTIEEAQDLAKKMEVAMSKGDLTLDAIPASDNNFLQIETTTIETPMSQYQPINLDADQVKDYLKQNIGSFAPLILTGFLALLEKAMYRWVVNTEEYDEMVEGKTASQYPAITYLTYKLETIAL